MAKTGSTEPVPLPSLERLPYEVLEKVFSHLPYKVVSNIRLVSTRMNDVIKQYLTHSYQHIFENLGKKTKALKHSLPRRESVRRLHPFANKLHILEGMHSRLGSLNIVLDAAISKNLIHFFAAELLDEAQRLMKYVDAGGDGSFYDVMEEIFDLCSMATDFFKEKIKPTLPPLHFHFNNNLHTPTRSEPESEESTSITTSKLKKAMNKMMKSMKCKKKELSELKHNFKKVSKIVRVQDKQLATMTVRVEESEKKSAELTTKIDVMELEMASFEFAMQVNRIYNRCTQSDSAGTGESKKRKSSAKEEGGKEKALKTK